MAESEKKTCSERWGVGGSEKRVTEGRSENVNEGLVIVDREGVSLHCQAGTLQVSRHVSLLQRKKVAMTDNDSRERKL